MTALELIGLVLVVLAAAVVAVLVVRRQRQASAAPSGPRTVADLVRQRAEAAGSTEPAPAAAEVPRPEAAQPPARPEPVAVSSVAVSSVPVASVPPAPVPPAPIRPAPVSAARSAPPTAPAPPRPPARPAAPVRPRPVTAAPEPAAAEPPEPETPEPAPAEKAPRAPGPDVAGADTPWRRAALLAAGDGGAGTWEPPAPPAPAPVVENPVPVPLRLVPPIDDSEPDADLEPDPAWTGWADWAEVDAEEDAPDAAATSGEPEPEPEPAPQEPTPVNPVPPTLDPEAEAEPVALPLGRRTPAERAAEQAAADMALLRTFGYGDPAARPDSAPVVSMVRPDVEDGVAVDKGAAQPVRFRVVRRDGATVAAAAVTLLDDRGAEVAEAAADAGGRGEVTAPDAGTFVLVSTAPGYQPGAVAVTVADAPVEADVLLARSASVSGAVQGEDGPISAARVTLVQDGEVVDAVNTDADGAYRITDIASGEYGISVAAAGCVPSAGYVEVPDETDLRHDVVLAPASPVAAQYGTGGFDDDSDLPDAGGGMMSGHRFS